MIRIDAPAAFGWLASLIFAVLVLIHPAAAEPPIVMITIDGPINPATDDFLKTSIARAEALNAKLLIIKLNTPGGLLTSMQTMVASLLDSPVPTAVYVTPSGGGAISAGVFITMAGHVAAMAPGTTIGAAHPVMGGGQDVTGDMRAKVENFAVSTITAIAEQRGRNIEWAEKAVRESAAITDREAVQKNVVDFTAADLEAMLSLSEGRTVNVKGTPVTLQRLKESPKQELEMTFKQMVINILSDPNIAILLGLAAMLGIGIELYHPGGVLPGLVGVICLVLSLVSAQVLPINYGGVLLLLLAVVFFAVEFFMPSFGLWGGAGIVCLVLGSIYLIDTDLVWSVEGFEVDRLMIGSAAFTVGLILVIVSALVAKATARRYLTGKDSLPGEVGVVLTGFDSESLGKGTVQAFGEIWRAKLADDGRSELKKGDRVEVIEVMSGLTLLVKPLPNDDTR